jgi:hypothetical protein
MSVVALGGDRDDVSAARAHLLDVADDLLVLGPWVAMNTTGMPSVNQRDRPVLHLRRGQPFGVDVADFLELERAFERDGVVVPAAQVKPVVLVDVGLGDGRMASFCSRMRSICAGILASAFR